MSTASAAIATSSVEDGFDFAAALVVAAVEARSDSDPNIAHELLKSLCRYVEWRYHGELGLALEMLSDLGASCHRELKSPSQYWHQVSWLAAQLGFDPQQLQALGIPKEHAP